MTKFTNYDSDKSGSNIKIVFGAGLFILGLFFTMVHLAISSPALQQSGVILITVGVLIYIAGND